MKDYIDFAFLDSGTGGIPYMLCLKEKRPDCRCVYLGDGANFPYGEKTPEQVFECASGAIEKMLKKWSPRAIVIACNTISVTSLADLRKKFPEVPIVGTVPAIRLGAKVTENHRIGLLATNATVNHPYCKKLTQDYASGCEVFNRGDPDLIAFIEHDLFTASEEDIAAAVKPAVDFFAANHCDTIILGCTHFTHIAQAIAKAAGPDVKVVDSREGVSNQALRVLESSDSEADVCSENEQKFKQNEKSLPEDMTFFVTGYRGSDTSGSKDENEYKMLCSRFNIPWGGLLN